MENVHSSSLLSDMAQTSDVMQKYYMQHICDAPEEEISKLERAAKENNKNMKKKSKKIRQKLMKNPSEYTMHIPTYDALPTNHNKILTYIKSLQLTNTKVHANVVGAGPDKHLQGLLMHLKQNSADRTMFLKSGGLTILSQIISRGPNKTFTTKSLTIAAQVFNYTCMNHQENQKHAIMSNGILSLLDVLNTTLRRFSSISEAEDEDMVLCVELLRALNCTLIVDPSRDNSLAPEIKEKLCDIVGYVVAIGLVEKMALLLASARGSLESNLL
ncbi:S phase cyclin A-associated protein in the endoplasmic reticulum-like [Ctenocephalides felis]|uniref:S phase cyclin A-associated protein in the endoplasmic reticulum-like n=1 Tax=Ctenocephalides felis TaxID=7515 RepID=UPI000E6E2786|nr:S phase cyclin A-associated protein in the endoplasmic reticulum-like [Ctenocephalides felis]